jgi:hypothetical protein
VIGGADPVQSIVLWVYKSGVGAPALFDKGLVYHTTLKRWAPAEIAGEYLASASRPGLTLESLDSISGSLDALPFSLDDVSTATLPNISAVNSAHKLGFFTGATLEAEMYTAEESNDGRRLYINGLRPITDASSIYCAVVKRENLNEAASTGDESAIDGDGNCPVLEETRYARGKLRVPAAAAWSFASGVEHDSGTAGWF